MKYAYMIRQKIGTIKYKWNNHKVGSNENILQLLKVYVKT